LELGFFLHGCFPVATEEHLLEDTFFLLYSQSGLQRPDVEVMSRREREWWIRRVAKQKDEEEAAVKKAQSDAKNRK
jgi:hypothetical protein